MQPRSFDALDVGGRRSGPVHNVLISRKKAALCAVMTLSAGYAATWSLIPGEGELSVAASGVTKHLGDYANNLTQLVCHFSLVGFMAALFPGDLDSTEARRYIGPLLAVSNTADTYVVVGTVLAYDASRSEGARTSRDQRVCLYICFGVCAFKFVWGVIYTTWVFVSRRASWARLRAGMCIDAAVFWCAIAALWCHGETRYPPGEAPLHVALLGRPAIGLLAAAVFGRDNRARLAKAFAAAGFFHVQLDLKRLTDKAVRYHLTISGYETPVAAGNDESLPSNDSLGDEDSFSTTPTSQGAPASHHTAKLE
jgi:hypothetical protein